VLRWVGHHSNSHSITLHHRGEWCVPGDGVIGRWQWQHDGTRSRRCSTCTQPQPAATSATCTTNGSQPELLRSGVGAGLTSGQNPSRGVGRVVTGWGRIQIDQDGGLDYKGAIPQGPTSATAMVRIHRCRPVAAGATWGARALEHTRERGRDEWGGAVGLGFDPSQTGPGGPIWSGWTCWASQLVCSFFPF
jgi:hypothetical protein